MASVKSSFKILVESTKGYLEDLGVSYRYFRNYKGT